MVSISSLLSTLPLASLTLLLASTTNACIHLEGNVKFDPTTFDDTSGWLLIDNGIVFCDASTSHFSASNLNTWIIPCNLSGQNGQLLVFGTSDTSYKTAHYRPDANSAFFFEIRVEKQSDTFEDCGCKNDKGDGDCEKAQCETQFYVGSAFGTC